MQEHTVTAAGQTHALPEPFFVLATQNPIEQAGTYPLPEAQLDRFLLRIDVGYPTEDEEMMMVGATTHAGLRDAPPPEPLRVTSANAPETLEALRDLKPDVIVVNGTRILSRALLGGAPAPFINMHAGITPLYRGVHGGYWALAQGDPANCGVTVHLVDPGVDTGEVLYQARVQPTPRDSYFTYPYLQLAAGVPLLLRAVEDALQGRLAPMRAQGSSAQWSHPGLTGYLWRRLARGVR
jgi:folate-dependent phosphoribosylglycinamide formyltransferase PurN